MPYAGLTAFEGSVVNVSGGSVGDFFVALTGSEVNISGGDIDALFGLSGAEINLFGSEFFINDLLLNDTLILDEAFAILDRGEDVILSGLFVDGTPFSFDLSSGDIFADDFVLGENFFDPDTTLTVTLVSTVPEPGSMVLLGLSGLLLLGRQRKTL